MKKLIVGASVIGSIISVGFALPAFAQIATSTDSASTTTATATTTSGTSLDAQIQALLAEIASLKAQLEALIGANTISQGTAQQIQQTFQFTGSLHIGMSGGEVQQLQQVLASDPTLFSKSDVTGYFGPVTENAVIQFQKHFGINAIGVVGPLTMEKLNELLKSGDVSNTSDLTDHQLGNLDDNEGGDNQGNATSTAASEGEHGNATSTSAEDNNHSNSSGSSHAGEGGDTSATSSSATQGDAGSQHGNGGDN